MVWTLSETETIKEILRSSMYLAIFVMALGALTSWRQVGPLVDISVLVVASVAGYGLLQKINSHRLPGAVHRRREDGLHLRLREHHRRDHRYGGGARVGADGYPAQFRLQGALRALMLSFLVALYPHRSARRPRLLGIGTDPPLRPRQLAPADARQPAAGGAARAWLWWRMQSLPGLFETGIRPQEKLADGTAFRNDLILALLVAFALQAGYAVLMNRYEPCPQPAARSV